MGKLRVTRYPPCSQQTNEILLSKEEEAECSINTNRTRTHTQVFKADQAKSRHTMTLHLRVSPEELSALAAGSASEAWMTGTMTADLWAQ